MQIDIKGKINEKRLAFSNTLLPLFETIVNSIQAIEKESATSTGIIEIDIIRSAQKGGYHGLNDASHFGLLVPVISVQTVPFLSV